MRGIIAIIVLMGMASCSSWGEIKIENQKNGSKPLISMSLYHEVTESKLDNAQVLYQRQVEQNTYAPISVQIHFYSYYYEPMLSDIAYVRIDDKSYKVSVVNLTSELGNTGKYVDLKGDIVLTKEMQGSMLAAAAIQYRLYSGRYPVTLKVSEQDLANIKRFLQYRGASLK